MNKPLSLLEIFNEALGVPEGLIETSKEIYTRLLKQLSTDSDVLNKVQSLEGKEKQIIVLPDDKSFNISDYSFSKAAITLVPVNREVEEIEWIGMAVLFKSTIDSTSYRKYKFLQASDVRINITLLTNPSNTWEDVYNFLNGSKKVRLMASLAHELKHAYDQYKSKGEPAVARAKYQTAASGASGGIKPLDFFNYIVYYTTVIESLVRPSELAAELKYNGVTKKDFLEALKKTEIYENIKQIKEFSYEKMKQQLKERDNIKKILQIVKRATDEDSFREFLQMPEDELVETFLSSYFYSMKTSMINDYIRSMSESPFDFVYLLNSIGNVNMKGVKEDAIRKFEKEINHFKDHDSFFKYEIKKAQQEADRILRKVAKLYAYIDE